MLRNKIILCIAMFTMSISTVSAMSLEDELKSLAQSVMRSLVETPDVVNSVNAQNVRNASLSQSDIDKLDKQWRAETKGSGGTMVNKTLSTDLSTYLKKVKSEGRGMFTEIFVMDNHGLNVGQSDMTSDYWQGDEAKWKKTFLVGESAVHVSEVEFDESTQTYQAQVSIAILDPKTKTVIGAATFGVNADAIQ